MNLNKNETTMEETEPNKLTQAEKEEGWILLFDGENINGWRGVNRKTFPSVGWKVVDGLLHCSGTKTDEFGQKPGGDILYDEEFSDFHLKFEYKLSEGANSGVFYLGKETEGKPIYVTALEFQILDNERHPDANCGINGNRKSASLCDLIPANPQNTKPPGEWNMGGIRVQNGTVTHRQNGEPVLEYQLWTPEWKELVAGSKFPELNENWANVAKEGFIALQDHGDNVWFRGIKIRRL